MNDRLFRRNKILSRWLVACLVLSLVLPMLAGGPVSVAQAQEEGAVPVNPESMPAGADAAVLANQTITLGQAAGYAILGYNILLHNADIWNGPVGVGYNNATGVGSMQVESPGVVHDAPVYRDPSATVTGSTGPANLMQGIVVQEMDQAFADAMQAYNDALLLTPDFTVTGSINSATTIAATHGGQYVVKITGDIKSQLVLTPYPGASTKFIVILDGTVTLGGSDTVGAATSAGAQDVLIVVNGAGATMTSHINNRVYGTMLAPYRGASFHGFNGSFIGGDLQAKFMSDCQIYYVGYEEPPMPVCLGEAATFGILGTNGGAVTINSSTSLIGDVGYSLGVNSTTNQKVDTFIGTAYVHSQVAAFNYTPATFQPSGGIQGYPTGSATVDAKLDQANVDALTASADYSTQPVNVNLGDLADNDNRTVNRVGPITVVQIGNWTYNSDVLTLVGQAGQDDAFIVNVLGNLDFSQSEIRLTNVRPERVVFNFPNSASTILINKSATIWNGTILAPTLSSVSYHNPATFNGAIIANGIYVHSDFNLNHKRLDINCEAQPDVDLVKYVSVDNQATWDSANAAPGPTATAGSPVYFRFVVTNVGNTALSSVTLSDNIFDLSSCPAIPSPLPAGDQYVCVYGPVSAIAGQHSNAATTSGAYNGQTVQATDPAYYLGIQPAAIGDYVWNDINGDGLQNEGAGYGINGVVLQLYRDNGNGVFEPGADDTLVLTQTTTGDGAYQFANLPPGSYWVDVDQTGMALGGYTLIPGAQSGPDPKLVTVNSGDTYTAADFGYAGKGIVSGVVFYDWDSDGSQDLGEDPIPNTEVCLYKDNNRDGLLDGGDTNLTCMLTDSGGAYAFADQVAGAYLAVQTQPAGLQDTTPNVLPVLLVIVGPSGSAPDNNFGEIVYVRLGDMVYVDLNGNSQQDANETFGVSNVPLELTGTNVRGDSVNWTGVTGIDGRYLVDNLLPGDYTVKAPASFNGYQLTSQAARTTALTIVITEDLTLDFGYILPTGVGVYEFKAVVGRGQVTLNWLAFGPQPPSFHVLRADNSKSAGIVQLTAQPVTSGTGAYQFVDKSVVVGQTCWYTLLDVNSGQTYGPLAVTVVPMSIRAFLPSVGR